MTHDTKPSLEEAIEHYGVKGMKWGVRKDRDISPALKPQTESGKQALKSLTPTELKNVTKFQRLSDKKFEPSEADGQKRSLSPEQKKALKVAGGVLAVAAVAGTAYYFNRDKLDFSRLDAFERQTIEARKSSWGDSKIITDQTRKRAAFELPEGHKFLRLSSAAETSFAETTYTTSSVKDYNRYLSVWNAPEKLYKVEMSAKETVKVPDFSTVTGTLRTVMGEGSGTTISDTEVEKKFVQLAGGEFSDGTGKKLLEALRQQGYSAIVDEMDAGVQSQTPLVLIDSTKFTEKVATVISDQDRVLAKSLVELIEEPKIFHSAIKEGLMIHDTKPSLEEAIEHYGVKGMKWGVRRNDAQLRKAQRQDRKGRRADRKARVAYSKGNEEKAAKKQAKADKAFQKSEKALRKSQIPPEVRNRRLVAGAAVAATVLTVYGANKASSAITERSLAKAAAAAKAKKQAQQLAVLKEAQRNNRKYEIGKQIGENWLKDDSGESELLRVWSTAIPPKKA